jgi:hypothetical protein
MVKILFWIIASFLFFSQGVVYAQDQINGIIPFTETPVIQQFVTSDVPASPTPPNQPGSLPVVGGDTQATGAIQKNPSVIPSAPVNTPQLAPPTPVISPTTPITPTVVPSTAITPEPGTSTPPTPPGIPASGLTLYPNAPNTQVLPIQPLATDLPPPIAPTIQTILPTPYLLPVTQPQNNSTTAISGANVSDDTQGLGRPTKPDFLVEPAAVPEFVGGLNENAFVACERTITQFCTRSPDLGGFQVCMNKLRQQPGCSQFVTFASLSGFAPGSFVDLMQHYQEARLTLLHLSRGGANYAGDYYALGANGNFVNISSGPEAQAIDITKHALYPAIIQSYPNAQLWSIVDQLPRATAATNGQGLTLIFRFRILNGCATCEHIGYAYIAYDFSELGALQNVRVLNLEKAAP